MKRDYFCVDKIYTMFLFQTIRRGIITLFTILLAITFLTILSFFIYERQIKKVELNLNTINQINESIIRLGSLERDLFISESINPDFYENNEKNFHLENTDTYKKLQNHILVLKNQSNLLDLDIEKVNELEKELKKYNMLYDSASHLIRVKGWKDYGVEGKMRILIHDIENTPCPIDMRMLLTIRRHEKDFLLRKQLSYVDKLLEMNKELQLNIVKSCKNKTTRDTLLNWQSDYIETFLNLVELEKQIGFTNKDGIKAKLSAQTTKINNSLNRLNKDYINEAKKIRKIARAFLLGILILAVMLNIFVVSFLIRKFGNPINKLTYSILNSVNNNFDKNFKIYKINSKDEIGKLSASFEYMLKNVHERTDLILQKNIQIEKSYEELKRLSKLGREIASKLKNDEVIQKANKAAKRLITFDFFAIGIFDDIEQKLIFANYEKTESISSGTSFRSLADEKSLTVYSYLHQKRLFINDITAEYKQYLSSMPNDDEGEDIFHSLIYLPLTYLDIQLGVMVIKKKEKNYFSQFDYNILKNLALYVSLALQNADIYKTLQNQTRQIEKQKEEMQLQNDQIKASIRQAHTMQLAILPTFAQLNLGFEYSLLYKPKDIVSGDFYWFRKINTADETPFDSSIYVVADCTGHGVPGALLTLIGTNLLEEIISKEQTFLPAAILEKMDERIRQIFNQTENFESKDGMDVAICKITNKNADKYEIVYAGAKRPLYYFDHKNNKIKTVKGTRRTIGGTAKISKEYFINQTIELRKNDVLFMTTDGYVDQHDKTRKRFGTTKFLELLEEIASLPSAIHAKALDKILLTYMQEEEQRDDITVLSLKI